jgi:hypothetical protein
MKRSEIHFFSPSERGALGSRTLYEIMKTLLKNKESSATETTILVPRGGVKFVVQYKNTFF